MEQPITQVNPSMTVPQNNQAVAQATTQLTGWSWGSFILGPAFLLAVKKYYYLLLYLLFLIPFIGSFAGIGISIFMGIKGRQFVYQSTIFNNQSEANGFIKAIDHAGKVLFFGILTFLVGGGILGMIFFSFFSHNLQHARQVSNTYAPASK